MRPIKIAAALILLFGIPGSVLAKNGNSPQPMQSGMGWFLGALPSSRNNVDENEVIDFSIGPLVFHIPNRLLAFPWQRGTYPNVLPSCKSQKTLACQTIGGARSVFLIFEVAANSIQAGQPSFKSAVTLGFDETYAFHGVETPEQFSQRRQKDDPRLIVTRLPSLDSSRYDVVLVRIAHPFNGQVNKKVDYHFIARDGRTPTEFSCEGQLGDHPFHSDTICISRAHFLEDKYPVDPATGQSAYSLEYTFPWALVDHAHQIETVIESKVLALPHSSQKTEQTH